MSFSPTASPAGDPSTCWCCGRHATTLGLGRVPAKGERFVSSSDDPRYLCEQCIPWVEHIRAITKWDHYEQIAMDDAGQHAGGVLDRVGKTDLATLSAEEWQEFVFEVINGFGISIRRQVASKEIPF